VAFFGHNSFPSQKKYQIQNHGIMSRRLSNLPPLVFELPPEVKPKKRKAKKPTAHLYRRASIFGYNPNTTQSKVWANQKEAADYLGVKKGAISACIIRAGRCQGWELTRGCDTGYVTPPKKESSGQVNSNLRQISAILAGLAITKEAESSDVKDMLVPLSKSSFFTIDTSTDSSEWVD
jgi:hypothetical protein